MKRLSISAILISMIVCASAQTQSETLAASGIKADKNLIYRQKNQARTYRQLSVFVVFLNRQESLQHERLRGRFSRIGRDRHQDQPAGHSIAFLSGTGKKAKVDIRPLGHANIKSATIKGLTAPRLSAILPTAAIWQSPTTALSSCSIRALSPLPARLPQARIRS